MRKTSAWGFAEISSVISNLKKNDYREVLSLALIRFAAGEPQSTHRAGICLILKLGGFWSFPFRLGGEPPSSIYQWDDPPSDGWFGD